MSAKQKLQGGTDSEVTKLKGLWLDTLTESQRDFWRSEFVSKQTQAQLRAALKQKLDVNLLYDSQLTRFRDWVDDQLKLDLEAERQADDERRLLEENPFMSKEELREKLLMAAYRRANASGDFKLGLAAMKQDKSLSELSLDRDKFQFDAAKAALAVLPELLAIKRDSSLSEDAKLEQARLKLFGTLPASTTSEPTR